ncbi:MAG: pentapeptide repeat-containing protein [Cyanobacteriota bacterium]|nr:pentapeptide repeat-containing protein [Cyanobacteriota bacterium]
MTSFILENYHKKNLYGRSFKGRDLTGADFSFSELKGVDFTGANLTGANFYRAKTGLTAPRKIALWILATFLVIIAGNAAAVNTYVTIRLLIPKNGAAISWSAFLINVLVNAALWTAILRQGTKKAWSSAGFALIAAVPMLAIFTTFASHKSGYLQGFIAFRSTNLVRAIATGAIGNEPANILFSIVVAVGATIALVAALSLAQFFKSVFVEIKPGNSVVIFAEGLAIMGAGMAVKNRAWHLETIADKLIVVAAAAFIAWLFVYLACLAANKFVEEDEKYALLRPVAIAIAAAGGTNFKGADLTDANFSQADLTCSDFRLANLTRACWRNAEKLSLSRLDNTILAAPEVRQLLVSGDGHKKYYVAANLRGANLVNADLSYANFKTANLSEATLEAACLDWANLTEVQAIGTDFSCAKMTGVRLDSWNINSKTKLEEVDSKFVYLLESPKPGTDDSERRPCSGNFAEGEFTKLFEKVTNTIDFIFHQGIEWKPFIAAVKLVKEENEGLGLTINSIENKGDGVVVIKVSLPPDANKYKVHQQFKDFYENQIAGKEEVMEEKMQYMLSVMEEIVDN